MWAALALALLASASAPPVVALLPLRRLGAPPDVVHAIEVTLRNELGQLQEARPPPGEGGAPPPKRGPGRGGRPPFPPAAAGPARARPPYVGAPRPPRG